MLRIEVVMSEDYDEATGEFIPKNIFVLELEHSLASLSKWESVYEKPFLVDKQKTPQEVLFYFMCMTLTPDVPSEVYSKLSEENIDALDTYINSKQSATTFSNLNEESSRETVTAELIYYWMVAMGIDWQTQYWHLNKLLTLIRVVNLKNAPKKKMSQAELAQRNRELNMQRRAQLGTSG